MVVIVVIPFLHSLPTKGKSRARFFRCCRDLGDLSTVCHGSSGALGFTERDP